MQNNIEYEDDFYGWAFQQAHFLQNGEIHKLDILNLHEEIESLGRSEKRTLESYLRNFFMHLLKKQFQPERYCRSWQSTINESLSKFIRVLNENPSLKPKLNEIFKISYKDARKKASDETGIELEVFPESCPWTIEEVLNYE